MLKKIIKFIYSLLAIITIAFLLTYIRIHSDYVFYGDTAQLYLILENLNKGIGAFNPIQPSLIDFIDVRSLGTLNPADICKSDFSAGPYTNDQYNHFKFHSYFILAPLSILLKIININYLVLGLHFLAFILLVFFAGLILKQKGTAKLSILIICFVISLHPAWSWAIQGQPYVDRLYLPFGIIIAYLTITQKRPLSISYLFILISCLIVEKTIIYNAIFLISYSLIFFNKKNKSIYISQLAAGVVCLVSFILLKKYYIVNAYYSSAIPLSLESLINNVSYPDALNGCITLFLISLPLLIPQIFYNKRLLVISLIMLLPNFVGNIGGAEKVGFFTHYHSLYFPFLVFNFVYSIPNDYSILNAKRKLISFSLILSIFFYLFFNIGERKNLYLDLAYKQSYITNIINEIKQFHFYGSENEIVIKTIPPNVKITTIEAGMPFLYMYRDLHFFPLNLGISDYLILNYQEKEKEINYFGYFGYLGQKHIDKVNECLSPIIEKYYDIDNGVKINRNLIILKLRNLSN